MTNTIPTKRAGNFSLPLLGLGTWTMGGRFERDPNNDDARDMAAIRAAIEMGITHIDTAEMYAAGKAEELVGEAMAPFERARLFITTKVMGEHLRYDDVVAVCKRSLKRLRTPYVDLYLIHYDNPGIPLQETMRAMDYLVEQGMIKYIGVSNFTPDLIEEAQRHTKNKIVNNQIYYNLAIRGHEAHGTLDFCAKNNILVSAYRPLEKGEFSSNPLLRELGVKYNKTPLQVALNWVINRPNIVALVKTSNPQHLQEDLGALGWQLAKEDEEWLNREFPREDKMFID